jgi:Protein of unknown function (DUF4058)
MRAPFPGMDPWLEGYIWPDVHSHLARVFAELIAPQIAPKYVARIDTTTIFDNNPNSEMGIIYPDVEVIERQSIMYEPMTAYGSVVETEPTQIAPFILPIRVRIPVVEIRDVAHNKLVTAIEILSPVNKRKPNLADYRKKIINLHQNGVHVLEIDLLRRGTRPFTYPNSASHYQMMLLRAGTNRAAYYSVNIQDKLPVLPVPLLSPDPDVLLNLNKSMALIFERSLYHLSIDYEKSPPPPTFSDEEKLWIKQIVEQK